MGKIKLVPTVSTEVEGKATVSNTQQDSYNASPIEYTQDHGYAVVVQKAHQVPVSYQGQEFKSKRVFAVEVVRDDKGKLKPTGNLTAIKLSNIRQTYFGEVVDGEDAPVIPTYVDENDKRRMNTEGVEFIRAVEGSNGLACKDNTPYVKYPIIFWYLGQKKGYTPHFEENALQADDDNNLVLDETTINCFRTEPAGNQIDFALGDIIDLSNEKLGELTV